MRPYWSHPTWQSCLGGEPGAGVVHDLCQNLRGHTAAGDTQPRHLSRRGQYRFLLQPGLMAEPAIGGVPPVLDKAKKRQQPAGLGPDLFAQHFAPSDSCAARRTPSASRAVACGTATNSRGRRVSSACNGRGPRSRFCFPRTDDQHPARLACNFSGRRRPSQTGRFRRAHVTLVGNERSRYCYLY